MTPSDRFRLRWDWAEPQKLHLGEKSNCRRLLLYWFISAKVLHFVKWSFKIQFVVALGWGKERSHQGTFAVAMVQVDTKVTSDFMDPWISPTKKSALSLDSCKNLALLRDIGIRADILIWKFVQLLYFYCIVDLICRNIGHMGNMGQGKRYLPVFCGKLAHSLVSN